MAVRATSIRHCFVRGSPVSSRATAARTQALPRRRRITDAELARAFAAHAEAHAQSMVARGLDAVRPRRDAIRRRRCPCVLGARSRGSLRRARRFRSTASRAAQDRDALRSLIDLGHVTLAATAHGAADDSRGFPRRARRLDHRLDGLRAVREPVFIVEQQVPIEDEMGRARSALAPRARARHAKTVRSAPGA